MSAPDKPKVLDEEWSDERVESFLFITPYVTSISTDYQVLIKAYQAMRAGDFERFLAFFTEAGRDLNASDGNGQTILDHISEHRRSVDYVGSLQRFGAKKTGKE